MDAVFDRIISQEETGAPGIFLLRIVFLSVANHVR